MGGRQFLRIDDQIAAIQEQVVKQTDAVTKLQTVIDKLTALNVAQATNITKEQSNTLQYSDDAEVTIMAPSLALFKSMRFQVKGQIKIKFDVWNGNPSSNATVAPKLNGVEQTLVGADISTGSLAFRNADGYVTVTKVLTVAINDLFDIVVNMPNSYNVKVRNLRIYYQDMANQTGYKVF